MNSFEPTQRLDSLDIQLLLALSRDARVSQKQLAQELGMSAPGVADRIARLKARGVIRGFSVDINWDVIGYSSLAYISVSSYISDSQESVVDGLLALPGVEEVSVVAGSLDILMRVRAQSLDDIRRILMSDIRLPGVRRSVSSIVLLQASPPNAAINLLEAMTPNGA